MLFRQYAVSVTLATLAALGTQGLAQSKNGPLYKPCDWAKDSTNCSKDLASSNRPANSDCAKDWCTQGPALFTPTQLDVCENEVATMSTRVSDGMIDLKGNVVVNDAQGRPDEGLNIDWDDGSSTTYDLKNGTNYNPTHPWVQATTYVPSLLYHDQLKYDDRSSSCSYECRLQASIHVKVHLKTAPECVGGHYHHPGTKSKAATNTTK